MSIHQGALNRAVSNAQEADKILSGRVSLDMLSITELEHAKFQLGLVVSVLEAELFTRYENKLTDMSEEDITDGPTG